VLLELELDELEPADDPELPPELCAEDPPELPLEPLDE